MTVQQEVYFLPLDLEHIPLIIPIENEAYPEPWSYNMFRQELENEMSYFCVMFLPNILSGYGGYWLIADEAHLTRVTIAPQFRGYGLSKKLMAHLQETARTQGATTLRLEVRETNLPAIGLYYTLGFIEEGRRKAYYRNSNEDAIVMVKRID